MAPTCSQIKNGKAKLEYDKQQSNDMTQMSSFTTSYARKTMLPSHFIPSNDDVICAKGKAYFCHPGNQRFRDVVNNNLFRYANAKSRVEKSVVVNDILKIIRQSQGGFVRQEGHNWYEIGDDAARNKIGMYVRDQVIRQDPEKIDRKRKRRATQKARRELKSTPQAASNGESENEITTMPIFQQQPSSFLPVVTSSSIFQQLPSQRKQMCEPLPMPPTDVNSSKRTSWSPAQNMSLVASMVDNSNTLFNSVVGGAQQPPPATTPTCVPQNIFRVDQQQQVTEQEELFSAGNNKSEAPAHHPLIDDSDEMLMGIESAILSKKRKRNNSH